MSFKKGQTVHHIGPWDDKACMVVTKLTVASCGKKQMLLVNGANEKFMGRNFLPTEVQCTLNIGDTCTVVESVFANLSDEQAEVKALEMAKAFKANRLARCRLCIKRNAKSEGYVRAMQTELAKIEAATPSFRWR